MGATSSKRTLRAHIIARTKCLHACQHLRENWHKHAANIQLLVQCCNANFIEGTPDNVDILGVKITNIDAFAVYMSAYLTTTTKVKYDAVKHHLELSIDGAQPPTSVASYFNHNGSLYRRTKSTIIEQ